MGAIFGRDQKAYNAWRAKTVKKGVGLTGAALERVIMGLAVSHPDLVEMRG